MSPFLAVDQRAAWGPGSLEMALPLVEALGITSGMRVLEVGAGSGQIATVLARHWDVIVVTLEPWHGGEDVQERAAAAGVWPQVLALKQRIEDAPFAANSFDAVLSIGSFEMIGDARPEALAQMVRVTRPGGRIGIAEPMCLPTPIPDELAELDDRGHLNFQHCFRTLDWNRALFERSGLTVTVSSYFPEARRWWLEYRAQGRIPALEQELILQDEGRWLSLGLVVGQKGGAQSE